MKHLKKIGYWLLIIFLVYNIATNFKHTDKQLDVATSTIETASKAILKLLNQ